MVLIIFWKKKGLNCHKDEIVKLSLKFTKKKNPNYLEKYNLISKLGRKKKRNKRKENKIKKKKKEVMREWIPSPINKSRKVENWDGWCSWRPTTDTEGRFKNGPEKTWMWASMGHHSNSPNPRDMATHPY